MGAFYGDVLGLDTDRGRWEIPGIAGYFLDMGNDCQIHLLGSDGPSPYSQGPGCDPVENHVALAVRDIAAAETELQRLAVDYWKLDNVAAPELMQLFLRDPVGNLIELHQGRIEVSSKPQRGTTVRVILPASRLMPIRAAG